MIPKDKPSLVKAINDNYQKLRIDLIAIPPELAATLKMDGHAKGNTMTVNNLLSYLIGWGELVLKWHKKHSNKETIDFPETGFKWNQLGLLAQKFYEDYNDFNFKQLLKKLDKTVEKILVLIDSLDNSVLYDIPFYEKYPLGRMIQLNTSSPYKNARTRVRKWKRQNEL